MTNAEQHDPLLAQESGEVITPRGTSGLDQGPGCCGESPNPLTFWDAKPGSGFGFLHLADDEALETKALQQQDKLKQNMEEFTKKLKEWERLEDKEWNKKVKEAKAFKVKIAEVTVQQFIIAVSVLRSRTIDYLQSMSVPLLNAQWPEWAWLQREEAIRDELAAFGFDADLRNNGPEKWKANRPKCLREWWLAWDYLKSHNAIAENCIHWIPARKIVAPDKVSDHLRVIKALHNTGADSGVWKIPICWAILHYGWQKYEWRFVFARSMDVVFLASFMAIQYYAVFEDEAMPMLVIIVSALCCFRSIFGCLVEQLMLWWEFGTIEGLAHWLTIWNVVLFLLEVLNAFVMLPLLYLEYGHRKVDNVGKSAFKDHPVLFSFVVGTRWVFLLMALMCTRAFGRNVFPAWHAMTRPTTLYFVAFIMLGVFAALQSYMTFPIEENLPTHGASLWTPFMKVFRFAVLGDFDTFELEGVDGVIKKMDKPHSDVAYEVDDGEVSESYHDGIMDFVLAVSICLTILSMNVAIGVVGSAYDEAKENALQIHGHFKAGYLFKIMLHERFWGCLSDLFCCCCKDKGNDGDDGFLLSASKAEMSQEPELDEKVASKIDEALAPLASKLSEVMNKLDELAKKQK